MNETEEYNMIMIKALIEFAFAVLLIYGFAHEKQVIEFEQLLKKAIVIKYKLYKKNKALAEMRKNRDFKVVNGGKAAANTENGVLYVA